MDLDTDKRRKDAMRIASYLSFAVAGVLMLMSTIVLPKHTASNELATPQVAPRSLDPAAH